jgi:GNAT superfamily N-acetyltransferase
MGVASVWVASIGPTVVGFAGLDATRAAAEIEPVCVSAAHRRQGVGRQLVAAIVAEARQRGLTQLRVRPVARNVEALMFFDSCGFDVLGHVDLQLDLVERDEGRGETASSLPARPSASEASESRGYPARSWAASSGYAVVDSAHR